MDDTEITYDTIIGRVREKLNCGSDRISDSPAALRWSWWPNVPDFYDELLSDYGADRKFKDIEKEFYEEIQAIRESLNEQGHESSKSSLNQVATAQSIWDQIGIPIRRKDQTVYRIWSPKDVMGLPIIKALPVDLFINGAVEKTASCHIEIERLKKIMDKWRLAAILLGAIVGLRILAWVL